MTRPISREPATTRVALGLLVSFMATYLLTREIVRFESGEEGKSGEGLVWGWWGFGMAMRVEM